MPQISPVQRSVVIVGGDGAIGRQLVAECEARGISFLASTRRVSCVGPVQFFLDLEQESTWNALPKGDGPVILVAARVGTAATDDEESKFINIEAPVKLAERALAEKRRVIFLSTNGVFDGSRAFSSEDDPTSPAPSPYSKQKAEAERRLGLLPGWASFGNVVRLTKVLSWSEEQLAEWKTKLGERKPITPYSNLVFAPVSVRFVARSLVEIATSSHCGTMHVSGAVDITWADLARQLVSALPLSDTLVKARAAKAGTRLHRHSALSMKRTSELTGIAPQSVDSVIADLLSVCKSPALH